MKIVRRLCRVHQLTYTVLQGAQQKNGHSEPSLFLMSSGSILGLGHGHSQTPVHVLLQVWLPRNAEFGNSFVVQGGERAPGPWTAGRAAGERAAGHAGPAPRRSLLLLAATY